MLCIHGAVSLPFFFSSLQMWCCTCLWCYVCLTLDIPAIVRNVVGFELLWVAKLYECEWAALPSMLMPSTWHSVGQSALWRDALRGKDIHLPQVTCMCTETQARASFVWIALDGDGHRRTLMMAEGTFKQYFFCQSTYGKCIAMCAA